MNGEQQICFDAFLRGESMCITGPAGSGKSFLIGEIKKYCIENSINIALTALTGAAASLIGGTTLHGWSGIGLGKGSSDQLYIELKSYNKKSKMKNWLDTQVLIIDEISMMDAILFSKLHLLGQLVRKNNNELFGGIQLILCGDFAQLKPIVQRGSQLKYAFESATWKRYVTPHTYQLVKIMRQENKEFQDLLRRIRMGEYTSNDRKILNSRLITDLSDADVTMIMPDNTTRTIKSTILYPKRKDVDRINKVKLQELISSGEEPKKFMAIDTVTAKKSRQNVKITDYHTKIINSCSPVPSELILCVGAQVMLVKNKDFEKQLVNGSRGIVTEINSSGLPVVLFDNGESMIVSYENFETESGETRYTRKQIPLILAWSLTIHKCQGATLSSVITDLTEVFDDAQIYVTLSRARNLEGLFIINLNYAKIKCCPRVKEYYKSLCK
jgi:ATP-dependent DNA helicase PIF1